MAHYKVGNRYLNDKEYDEHVLELWGLFLFMAGAFITGYFMNGAIPEDWAKMWRFLLIVLPAVIVGSALSFLAFYVLSPRTKDIKEKNTLILLKLASLHFVLCFEVLVWKAVPQNVPFTYLPTV